MWRQYPVFDSHDTTLISCKAWRKAFVLITQVCVAKATSARAWARVGHKAIDKPYCRSENDVTFTLGSSQISFQRRCFAISKDFKRNGVMLMTRADRMHDTISYAKPSKSVVHFSLFLQPWPRIAAELRTLTRRIKDTSLLFKNKIRFPLRIIKNLVARLPWYPGLR